MFSGKLKRFSILAAGLRLYRTGSSEWLTMVFIFSLTALIVYSNENSGEFDIFMVLQPDAEYRILNINYF